MLASNVVNDITGSVEAWLEAGLNMASKRPHICREAIAGSAKAWFEAGLNMASKTYQVFFKFAEMY